MRFPQVHLKKLTRNWLLEINESMEERFLSLGEMVEKLDAELLAVGRALYRIYM